MTTTRAGMAWIAVLLTSVVVLPRQATAQSDETLTEIGDFLQIALPAAGGVTTVILGDWEGAAQWGASFGTMFVTVSGMKNIVDKTRPNRGEGSFPSGHTAASFMGASFIQRRYGWEWGIPSYALADQSLKGNDDD